MLEKLGKITQRETSGSDTFKNYDYQYHWAIYTLLENSMNNEDIAVLVEFHEDVILVEDLSSNNKLHFFQIKANEKHLTLNDITKRKDHKQSILDKLTLGNNFSELLPSIKSIKLVSANGFNFCSGEVNFYQLKNEHKKELENNLPLEIDKELFLERLYFSESKLPKSSFIQTVKGMLLDIVQKLYPDRKTNVQSIYLVIKNDIHDKGQRKLLSGQNILQEKGITFTSIKEVIDRYTDVNNDNLISAQELLADLSYPVLQKQIIKKELQKYSIHYVNTESIQAQIRLDILNAKILEKLVCCNNNQLVEMIDEFCVNQSSKYGTITTDQTIRAGVFYELSRYIRETA
jgi:similar to putative phage protein